MRIFVLVLLLCAGAGARAQMSGHLSPLEPKPRQTAGEMVKTSPALPSNPLATRRTRELYRSLQRLTHQGIMFGHQDDLAYGIGWKYEKGASDVRRVVGQYPAVYGWDLGHLELDSACNLDQVPFDAMRGLIREAYRRGGVNTISWHLRNPYTGGSSWDTAGAVRHILPGGDKHDLYLRWLDRVADFMLTLNDKGKPIPILFRPYHEHTGSWFWWGEKLCTPAEYIALWRMTADYLRQTRRVHHLLLVYSPAEFDNNRHFMERYPGDAYVDIIGFDSYMRNPERIESREHYFCYIGERLSMVTEIGRQRGKLVCFSETGLEQIPVPDWWTKTLWETIHPYPISYVLLWRNGRPDHYYVPYPGHGSADDFVRFAALERTLFEKDAAKANLYNARGFWGWLFRR